VGRVQPNQPELPFFGSDEGYGAWLAEREGTVRALEHRWGLPLYARVRLRLRDFARPFEGVIEFVVGTDRSPRFRIRGERFDFGPNEVESCERL
jgi:hypothetical protein